ncbi:hypothetical protein [Pseudarthrobacter sulfonivorans]|uniref:hypothetical protein n=1 Tax=Pseudarthrobacter sulfonivorans TaxID=121292 RepID=UPI00210497D3|nr:hypothetical protein [Pseudarthrobacter sulfonivorans]
MSVREPMRLRKALLAGMVALALTGAGTAIAWSAADSPSPSPSAPSPSPSASGKAGDPGAGKTNKAQRPQYLHGESVVKKADGTFETLLTQQGTVESVSASSVTVKSADGFTQAYAVNADTAITKVPSPAADGSTAKGDDGKRLKPGKAAIGDISTGQSVRISGVKSGSDVTALRIVEGTPAAPGKGLGLGKGQSKGHSQGHSHGQGQGQGKLNDDTSNS